MPTVLETVLHLDKNDNIDGLLDFILQENHDPTEILLSIWHLLATKRLRSAFALAMMLANQGSTHPAISMALSAGGQFFGNASEETRGLQGLHSQVDALSEEQQSMFYSHIVIPTITHLLEQALQTDDTVKILNILNILKASDPRLRYMLDFDAPIAKFSLETQRQQGRAKAKLISYPLPPPGTPRPRRRVLVAGRETFFMRPSSRLMDTGPRIVSAMNSYGWQAEFYGITKSDSVDECRAITERCRQQDIDILLLDDELLFGVQEARAEMILQLRQEKPTFKVVGFLHDTWAQKSEALTKSSALLDVVWEETSPASPIWQHVAPNVKMLYLPHPSAGNVCMPKKPLTPSMVFAGSVNLFNWHRAFWLAAIEHLNLPIHTIQSTHRADGLSALDSYALHMQELAEATCCFNISMRPNRDCIATGRSFEVIYNGSLLVQDVSPNMDRYFIAGEHYLEFSSLAELTAISRFLVTHREEAEEVRRCGTTFALEHYNDEKLIGYLDRQLYFPA